VEGGEMSEGKRFPREEAQAAALAICDLIIPVCARVSIAGSLRRGKPDVGDIEIVCIPLVENDLFGDEFYSAAMIGEVLHRAGFEMDKDGNNYKKFFFVRYQIWVDLFITTPEQWGVIFTIRTGPSDFSQRIVTQINKGGLLPSYLKVKDGRIWNGDQALTTPEEADVFQVLGKPWLEPCERK
jgi:DNA polymerase/3'-5' exonuclease PolX